MKTDDKVAICWVILFFLMVIFGALKSGIIGVVVALMIISFLYLIAYSVKSQKEK